MVSDSHTAGEGLTGLVCVGRFCECVWRVQVDSCLAKDDQTLCAGETLAAFRVLARGALQLATEAGESLGFKLQHCVFSTALRF